MYKRERDYITEYILNAYIYKPNHYTDIKRLQEADRNVASYIEFLEGAIKELKEHRIALAKRCNELFTLDYKIVVELKREKRYKGNVFYFLTKTKVYEDGTSEIISNVKYGGMERKQAIEEYKTIKKRNPNYEYILDIEKKSWER